MVKRFSLYLLLFLTLVILIALPVLAQTTNVTAEAISQANLRATTDTNAPLLGQITSGTRYPVIGRSEFFPWVLLADPATNQPIGWVFQELVTINGDVTQVPISELVVSETSAAPSLSPTPGAPSPTPGAGSSPASTPSPAPTLNAGIIGTVRGEINIRYAPGVEYPRVGVGRAGDQFEITGWHTGLPWVQIRYPQAPNGYAWVALELLDIQGDYQTLPSFSNERFELPTLTPTPSVIRSSAPFGGTPVPLSPAFQALGDQLYQMMLDYEFDNETSSLGGLFLMDLQTGEAFTFGSDIAFSGMSLSKIAILTALFREFYSPPDNAEAVTITEAMVCSENISSNEMLAMIGDGNPFTGATEVTNFLRELGLERSFITAPYDNDPFITPQPVSAPQTSADQRSATPDPFNQVTVEELGWLLNSVYECAYYDSGPLVERFGDQYTPNECRQVLNVMNNNRINAMFESGLPLNTNIAHKHGWIPDTHGDAGVIFTPGGHYVLVVIVHKPTWVEYSISFPLTAEISRTVYNYFNPDAPVSEIRPGDGAEQCQLLGNPLIEQLMTGS